MGCETTCGLRLPGEGEGQEPKQSSLFFLLSVFLGALAGVGVAYFALQYSIDLQKLVGLRGRYVTITLELQRLQKQKSEARQEDEQSQYSENLRKFQTVLLGGELSGISSGEVPDTSPPSNTEIQLRE